MFTSVIRDYHDNSILFVLGPLVVLWVLHQIGRSPEVSPAVDVDEGVAYWLAVALYTGWHVSWNNFWISEGGLFLRVAQSNTSILNSPGFLGPHSRLVNCCILEIKVSQEIVLIFVMQLRVSIPKVGCYLMLAYEISCCHSVKRHLPSLWHWSGFKVVLWETFLSAWGAINSRKVLRLHVKGTAINTN